MTTTTINGKTYSNELLEALALFATDYRTNGNGRQGCDKYGAFSRLRERWAIEFGTEHTATMDDALQLCRKLAGAGKRAFTC